MNVHKNAKLTPSGRALIVERRAAGETPSAIAMALGVSPATVYKWLRRFRDEGAAGFADRSSRPHRMQTTQTPEQIAMIEQLRRQRLPCWRIAAQVGISPATVARRCGVLGLSRLSALSPNRLLKKSVFLADET